MVSNGNSMNLLQLDAETERLYYQAFWCNLLSGHYAERNNLEILCFIIWLKCIVLEKLLQFLD